MTFYYVILEKRSYTHEDTQLDTLVSYVLFVSCDVTRSLPLQNCKANTTQCVQIDCTVSDFRSPMEGQIAFSGYLDEYYVYHVSSAASLHRVWGVAMLSLPLPSLPDPPSSLHLCVIQRTLNHFALRFEADFVIDSSSNVEDPIPNPALVGLCNTHTHTHTHAHTHCIPPSCRHVWC